MQRPSVCTEIVNNTIDNFQGLLTQDRMLRYELYIKKSFINMLVYLELFPLK